MLQAGNHRPTEVSPSTAQQRERATSPSISSSSAIAPPTRSRWRTSSTRSRKGKPVRTSIDDGVKALELADAATDVVAREAHRRAVRRAMHRRWLRRLPSASASPAWAAWAAATPRISRTRVPGARARRRVQPDRRRARRGRATRSASRSAVRGLRASCSRDPDVDAVFLVTPTRCIRRRSSRRCEPASTCSAKSRCRWTSTNACAVEAEAAKHPHLKVMIGFVRRFDASYQDAQTEHRRRRDRPAVPGALADLRPERSVGLLRAFAPTSGGIFVDMSVHDIDLARWLLGSPKAAARVRDRHRRGPRGTARPAATSTTAWRSCEFADGRMACFYASRTMAHGHETRDRDHRHRRPPDRRPRRPHEPASRSPTRTASAR